MENDEQVEIDYILVNKNRDNQFIKERNTFERNLRRKGLQVEDLPGTENERFVKITARREVLLQFCEIMKLRMPLRNFGGKANNLTEQFTTKQRYLFNVNSPNFIKPSIKYMILNFILEKEKFTEDKTENDDDDADIDDEEDEFGITKLIYKGAYISAYPLHDVEARQSLKSQWIFCKSFFKWMPLDEIKNYFGIKVALYFTWLEFYNVMLMIASTISLLYFSISVFTSPFDSIGMEICTTNNSFIICPQCDKDCEFWSIQEGCDYTTILHMLDNWMTVIFAIAMSVWSVVYLNMWNQYSAKIIHRWGIMENDCLDNNLPTEQYFQSSQNFNNYWKKLPPICFSYTMVIFSICIVLGVLVALMFYRISLSASERLFDEDTNTLKSVIVSVTGSIFDLISILVLNEVYKKMASSLTQRELHRTQQQYEESLMWKLYIFWFINYYSSFFYIAFLKGRFVGTPAGYTRIFGYRQEECGPGGCIVDLFIQLAVVLIGDTVWNNILEYGEPYVRKRYRAYRVNRHLEEEEHLENTQWIKDFKLLYWGSKETSLEYLEMVLQYGLVTLFVTAFPLAPVLALINNVLEIRFDATNLITNFRRPVAQNVKHIGIWIPIMDMISKLSVITNGCIIAFTTNLIPYYIYENYYKGKKSHDTFLKFTYSKFDTKDFDPLSVSNTSSLNITECLYSDFRNPPDHDEKYELSEIYWHILAARLVFVLVFQNFVSLIKLLVESRIPTLPKKLKAKIVTETMRVQRIIIKHESRKNRVTV